MRKLIHIPMVHTPQDLGSQLERVRGEYIARYGLERWRQHLREVEELWQRIRERLMGLPVDFSQARLYQDGLPVCGREREIVHQLADEGSINHQLLLELVKKGAVVMGTEDPDLLIQERDRLIHSAGENILLYDEVIERRDEYIAQRIRSTLKEGEVGLLFIGALHRVVERLPEEIEVSNLF